MKNFLLKKFTKVKEDTKSKEAKGVTKIYIANEDDLNKLINKLSSYRNRCEKYPELFNKINQLISDIEPSCNIEDIQGKDCHQQNIAILNKYMNFDLKILNEINTEIEKLSNENLKKGDKKLFSQIQSECGEIQKDRENEHYKEGLAGGDVATLCVVAAVGSVVCILVIVPMCASCCKKKN